MVLTFAIQRGGAGGALNEDAVTLLERKPSSLSPEALKSRCCLCDKDSCRLEHFCFLKKRLISC